MGHLSVQFLGKAYSIPADVLEYIDLLAFADSVQKELMGAFVRALNLHDVSCIDDEDMAEDIQKQVSRFISDLCDHGIYTRTVNDYLRDNKGYQLFSDVNKAALNKIKELLRQKLDTLQAGVEEAMYKRDSSITGMGFSIWSSSFIHHAVYAAMQASTLTKQEQAAAREYQRDINALNIKMESQYDRARSQYLRDVYIPHMETALTAFSYELLDKYISDLIAHQKFEAKTLDYVDIGRSNDLLENLSLSENKRAILENAFIACPFNAAVYMQAMKYELLDYDSFQTAKVFKQSDLILDFLKSSWGKVAYPDTFKINHYCINLWANLIKKTPSDLLHILTETYAVSVVNAYSRIADMLQDEEFCYRSISGVDEKALLQEHFSKARARAYVDSIVQPSIWERLVKECGQADLLDRIKVCLPALVLLRTKQEVDNYFVERLTVAFEQAKQCCIEQIDARKIEEKRRKLREDRQRQQQNKRIRNVAIITSLIMLAIVIAILVSTSRQVENISGSKVFLSAEQKEYTGVILMDYSVHNLQFSVPEQWDVNPSEDGTLLRARDISVEHGDGPTWTVKYYGQHNTVLDSIDARWEQSDWKKADFQRDYTEIDVEFCDEAYSFDETDEDGEWRAVDYYVCCNGSVFFFQYFADIEFFDYDEQLALFSLVDFESYMKQ